MGFKPTDAEQCLYVNGSGAQATLIALYVDDMAIATRDSKELDRIKLALSSKYRIKDIGEVKHILGMKVTYSEEGIHLSQGTYIEEMMQRFNMTDASSEKTPLPPTAVNLAPCSTNDHEGIVKFPYRECIGSLTYAAVCTRPDIAMAVNLCARFVENPGTEHVHAAKHILRYLKDTSKMGVQFNYHNDMQLKAYVDADYAGDKEGRRSITGFIGFLNGPVFWASKRQACVTLSSTESEYVAATSSCQEITWCRRLMNEIGFKQQTTVLLKDNQATIKLALSESVTRRCKHIDVRHHYIRELVRDGAIRLTYCPSGDNVADLMTKPLGRVKFCELRSHLMAAPPGHTGA